MMKRIDYANMFNLIGSIKIDTDKTIEQAVNDEVNERLKETDPEKKLGFFLLAFLDRATSDNIVKEKRNCWRRQGVENIRQAISENRFNYDGLRRFKEGQGIKETHNEVIGLLENQSTQEFLEYIRHNQNELLEITGVGPKLRDWSITNVTGKEYVIDRHIARVLLRTGIVNGNEFNQGVWQKIRNGKDKSGLSDTQYKKLKEEFSQINFNKIFDEPYVPFKATQYLWYFGRNTCKKTKPECACCCELWKEKLCKYPLTPYNHP